MRALALLLAAATLAAGCLGTQGATLAPQSAAATHVVGEDGAPIPYATYALLAAGAPVARGSAGLDGALWLPVLAWDTIVLSATGFEARALSRADLGAPTVALARAGSIDPLDATPTLRMLPPHEFDPYVFGPQAACSLRNTCGLSEPVLENAPNGVVYASATCCVGGSPPVWVSRDAGASWGTLDTPGVREAV
ncbi:MAG TPA: hypothetical protein VM370_11930, partial [Candidatus Thermoplasmatota archaeon]|nr:hypothetical protein [Candidatus Thermoplasmatota archaeon]